MTSGKPTNEVLDAFAAAIQEFASSMLDPYIEHLEYLSSVEAIGTSPKEVNDAVWGTVAVQPLEIIVLDSPLLQRLRRIRQLGLVHLVYPSGGHSRFEHSIGAMHQVTRVIDALNAHEEQPVISERLRRALRLAALCHDVGHGLMSHVSANALENFDSVQDIGLLFGERLNVEEPAPSEIAAYYMVDSASFRRLVKVAEDVLRDTQMPPNGVDLVRDSIVGKKISDEIPLLHELISGPFDADKLDYMTRDAFMTGVPVVTDISRLVQKVRATRLSLAELPPEVQRHVPQDKPGYWLTGIHISGDRTLDELLIGRALLFDKLYRHHKVRACEVMVAGIFRELAHLLPVGPALIPYQLDDAQLVELTVEQIEKLHGAQLEGQDLDRARIAVDLAERLKLRRLFVRAYAFAQNMPLDPYRTDRGQVAGLQQLALASTDILERGKLVEAIASQVELAVKSLSLDESLENLPTPDVKPYIWIDPPRPLTGATEVSDAYLISSEGKPLRFGEESAEATSWTNAYLLTSDIGYVFTIPELAPYVFLAVERVMREQFGVRTPRSMHGYAKVQTAFVDDLRRKLAQADYYTDAPRDIQPLPARLAAGDIPGRIEVILEKLSGYQGPVQDMDLAAGRRTSLARERVQNWLRQFDDDALIDIGLQMLERLAFVGRHALVQSLVAFLDANESFRGANVAPLGDPRDSSAILTYQAPDVGDAYGLSVKRLEEALAEQRPLIFVDDFIGTGQQAISIFERWLGLNPTTDLKEERAELKPALQELLKQTPVAVVFSAGTITGKDALQARGDAIGLDMAAHVAKTDLPTVFEPLAENEDHRERFLERCREVARGLLVDKAAGHNEEWAEQRLLGYGNGGYLVLFPHNTPTQTLTALWASKRDVAWEALFPRRKKR